MLRWWDQIPQCRRVVLGHLSCPVGFSDALGNTCSIKLSWGQIFYWYLLPLSIRKIKECQPDEAWALTNWHTCSIWQFALLSNLSLIFSFLHNKIETLPTDRHQHKPNLSSQILRRAIINRRLQQQTFDWWWKGKWQQTSKKQSSDELFLCWWMKQNVSCISLLWSCNHSNHLTLVKHMSVWRSLSSSDRSSDASSTGPRRRVPHGDDNAQSLQSSVCDPVCCYCCDASDEDRCQDKLN